ncbi:hypothetical protein [Collinsella sp. TF05-9AC]|uniref:hypothetical protein n=1 Tax=Collinsella sp. TF05-9AC TaxID=2292330 RepID=UPI000E4384C8|nr:hypothetical protein [Collinsella sp. TF05-9AC]
MGENRHLMTTILTRAKSKRTAIATAAVLLAAFLALAWPHAMPTGNKDEGNSAATTQREAAGATEEENETSSVARDGTDEASGPTAEDAQPEETTANERRTTGNGSDVPSSGENGKSSGKPESGNPSARETAPHQHNWVVQTKTVHHDAQYRTVHHDAVVKYVSICNNCGADITGNEAAHIKNSLLNGGNCGSCHEESRTVQAAYDEQVQVSAAWDETVTTGYKCSGCGATK